MKIKTVALIIGLLMPQLTVADTSATQDYDAANKLVTRHKVAEGYKLFRQAAEKANLEGNSLYVFHARYRASFLAYRLGQYSDCREQANHAMQCWKTHQSESWAQTQNIKTIRITILGLLERCAVRELRISQGWNFNRQAISLWKTMGYNAASDELINPELVPSMPPSERSFAWRLIEREAEYLSLIGNSPQAVKLLESAVASSEADTRSRNRHARLYSIKLIGSLARIHAFIGYKSKALRLFEKEQHLLLNDKPERRQSYINSRLNYLFSLTDLEGANEKTIAETNAILKEIRSNNYPQSNGFERLALDIINRKTNSAERQAALEALAKKNMLQGDATEVFFTTRNALFEQAKRAEPGLDTAFNEFLIQTQNSGDKKAEPRIYRVYGDWLVLRSRFAEAISMYQESLRMVEKFEWTPSVPMILSKIGAAYLASSQPDAAQRMWLRMELYIKNHPELPAYSILKARQIHCYELLRAGLVKEGKLLAKRSLEFGSSHGASEYWLSVFREKYIDQYLEKLGESRSESSPLEAKSDHHTFIHPIALNTLSDSAQGAASSFYLINRGEKPTSGILTIRGNGISLNQNTEPNEPSFSCALDQPISSCQSKLTINAASMIEIPLKTSVLPKDVANLTYQITWKAENEELQKVLWGIYHAGSKQNYAILESALCAPSPFIGVPILHHIQFPDKEDKSLGFRLRSETILRVEYRSHQNGKLIAVDNNCNGIFTDAGDFITSPANNPEKPTFPTVSPSPANNTASIEVWIYPRRNTPWDREIFLDLEINHPQNGWTEYSKNVIRPSITARKP